MIRSWLATNRRLRRDLTEARLRIAELEERTEAQIDYRDGLLEARAERIAELLHANALLLGQLATYKAREFMLTALRQRARAAADAPTAVYPARHQRRQG